MAETAPMDQKQLVEFPYTHSTGNTVGRFLAGLRDQKKIWGERAAGLGVVVPPHGYSEADGSETSEWVEVAPTGTLTAVAVVHSPVSGFHPVDSPFAYVLVKLDGADTALAHIVIDGVAQCRVGTRVEAVWAPDDARTGTIRDIASFRPID